VPEERRLGGKSANTEPIKSRSHDNPAAGLQAGPRLRFGDALPARPVRCYKKRGACEGRAVKLHKAARYALTAHRHYPDNFSVGAGSGAVKVKSPWPSGTSKMVAGLTVTGGGTAEPIGERAFDPQPSDEGRIDPSKRRRTCGRRDVDAPDAMNIS